MEKRKYEEEFKRDAVAMLLKGDLTASQLGRDLEIRPDLLSRWKREFQIDNSGKMERKIDPKDEEIKILKKELVNVKMERDILKKSVAIFSKI